MPSLADVPSDLHECNRWWSALTTEEQAAYEAAALAHRREHADELQALNDRGARLVAEREASLTPAVQAQLARQRAHDPNRLPLSGVPMTRRPGGEWQSVQPEQALTDFQRHEMRQYRSARVLLRAVMLPAVARTSPRRRGAGRPAVRGASRRSGARSGDSGDDAESAESEPSSSRTCAGCGGDLTGHRADARTCSATCRGRVARGQLLEPSQSRTDRPIRLVLDGATVGLLTEPQAARFVAATSGLRQCADHRVVHLAGDGCPQCGALCRALLETNGICTRRRPLPHEWRGERTGAQSRRLPVRRSRVAPEEADGARQPNEPEVVIA